MSSGSPGQKQPGTSPVPSLDSWLSRLAVAGLLGTHVITALGSVLQAWSYHQRMIRQQMSGPHLARS